MAYKLGIFLQFIFFVSFVSEISFAKEALLSIPIKSESGMIKLSVVSEEIAQQLVNGLAAQKHIPFSYVLDGCYARAHEMSWLLEKQGISSGKIFIAGPLKAWDRFRPGWWVEWEGYHVAPIIAVGDAKRVRITVIDPSVSDKLISVDEWLDLITINGVTKKHFITERYVYKFSSKKDNHRWLESDLKDAQETLNAYSNK